MSTNVVVISGNLGQEPKITTTKNDKKIANFSVAVNSREKKGDEWVDRVDWLRVVAFGGQVGPIEKYLKAGSKVTVQGKLRTSQYEKDGQTHYATDIIADSVDFNGNLKDNNEAAPSGKNYSTPADDEDIPF